MLKKSNTMIIAALIAFVLILGGCGGSATKKMITGMSATNQTIKFAAKEIKTMCTDGKLKEDVCTQAKDIYGKVKKADDAVINAAKVAVKLGYENPTEYDEYNKALRDLTGLVHEFLSLAYELGIL